MLEFEKVIGDIYRLKVPFEDIYTAVFLIRTEYGDILLDCATTSADVKEIIIPALEKMNVEPRYVVCSHSHGDHMGGLPYILERYKNAEAVFRHAESARKHPEYRVCLPEDGDILSGCIKVVCLPGHSADSIGLLDTRVGVLLSCDCVQLCGVSRYGTGISDARAYFDSLDRILGSNIVGMIASHEYYPLGSTAMGREALEKYISDSRAAALEIREFALASGMTDEGEIARLCNEHFNHRPPISAYTVRAMMKI